ncbi:MAG: phosphodiester glycosidase family protein, partial [Acidimicrobiales bacterium]
MLGVPAGAAEYSVLGEASIGTGVTYRALREVGPVTVHVAEIAPGAPVRFEAVVSNDQVATGLETTSSMCSRVGGIVCVNADFKSCIGCASPYGGIAHDGVPLRSPTPYHGQVSVGPQGWTTEPVQWTSRLTATYQVHVPEADPVAALLGSPGQIRVDTRELAIDGLNVDRPGDGLMLYTRSYSASTRTAPDGVEAIVSTDGPLALGTSRTLSLVELRPGGDAPIPANGFVLSGHGAAAEALRSFWQEFTDKPAQARQATIAIDSNVAVEESVGGHPVLLQHGQVVPQDPSDPFITARHPRTLLGWNTAGTVWLVVVDGRRAGYSRGVTIAEATDLLLQLGATDGINLDGGGSSTFVATGMC